MQLLHNMSAIDGGLSKYGKYSNSWSTKVKKVEALVEGLDQLLKVAKEQGNKLQEEVVTLKESWEMAIRDLEAWIVKKVEALVQDQECTPRWNLGLSKIESLLRQANEKTKVVKEMGHVRCSVCYYPSSGQI